MDNREAAVVLKEMEKYCSGENVQAIDLAIKALQSDMNSELASAYYIINKLSDYIKSIDNETNRLDEISKAYENGYLQGKFEGRAEKEKIVYRKDSIDAIASAIWHYPNPSFLSDYDHARELAEDVLKRLSSEPYKEEK